MRTIILVAAVLVLAACGQDKQQGNQASGQVPAQPGASPRATATAVEAPVPPRVRDDFAILRGGKLYQRNCASCHGAQGQGDPNWRHRGADGKFPPPPLNGTGHAWHHPLKILRYVIKRGSPGGQGNMPAWQGKLSDRQIDDIIAWFQSRWPDEVYNAWYRIDRRSKQ